MPLLKLPRRKLLTIDKQSIIVDVSPAIEKIDYSKIERARGLLKTKKLKSINLQHAIRSER